MKIDTKTWKTFVFTEIFKVCKGFYNKKPEPSGEGTIPFLSATSENNGVTEYYTLNEIANSTKTGDGNNDPLSRKLFPGHAVCVTNNGSVGYAYYQAEQFTCSHDVNPLYRLDGEFTEATGLFIASVIMKDRYRWAYGRKWRPERMVHSTIDLPATPDGEPDWQWMENYIKTLHHKPLITQNKSENTLQLDVENWKYFYLKNICDITMGNKMDWSAMTMENPEVIFVGRSSGDNGVAGKVDLANGVEPYKAGCITVALGGSLGSSYLQNEKFYTSQNVSVLEFEDNVSDAAKIFISCLIMNESKYKYFPFGRELNTHIRTDFGFTLPVQHNSDGTILIDEKHTYSEDGYVPDWQWMENYIKSLPYGDKLK